MIPERRKLRIGPATVAIVGGVLILLTAVAVYGLFWCSATASFSSCALDSGSILVRGVLIVTGVLTLALGTGLASPGLLARRRLRSPESATPPGPPLPPVSISWSARASIMAACLGIAIALLVAMASVPVPLGFTLHRVSIPDLRFDCPGIDFPSGSSVTFHGSDAASISFVVLGCSANQVVYQANGTGGSGSFVSTGGVYEFGAACPSGCDPADVTGTYTGPFLSF